MSDLEKSHFFSRFYIFKLVLLLQIICIFLYFNVMYIGSLQIYVVTWSSRTSGRSILCFCPPKLLSGFTRSMLNGEGSNFLWGLLS